MTLDQIKALQTERSASTGNVRAVDLLKSGIVVASDTSVGLFGILPDGTIIPDAKIMRINGRCEFRDQT